MEQRTPGPALDPRSARSDSPALSRLPPEDEGGPRSRLVAELEAYRGHHSEEEAAIDSMLSFLEAHSDAFSRSCREGHITGSAFIVNPERSRALFVHHAKFDRWLQPGGHCEAGEGALEASLREAFEETGLEVGEPFGSLPLDIDIHEIPARGSEPRHLHLDVRYLFVVEESTARVSEESFAVEWLSFAEARRRNPEASIDRPLRKIEDLGR